MPNLRSRCVPRDLVHLCESHLGASPRDAVGPRDFPRSAIGGLLSALTIAPYFAGRGDGIVGRSRSGLGSGESVASSQAPESISIRSNFADAREIERASCMISS